ncbi:cation diffusion facilitator CzcD-associated flavoprotein CzcO [Sinobacterium caligoides]|uniref:Cation diffusion facilitator CzcD-associated flavoprotein CzcO n=1 Tax=Sinobacterium caligoides TaxID=933926 RepID=A0A3N2DE07_9GAMM|nr:NAD(P)/FAD-dependent oxidoreductase [Sinobacterium caligoides]ROR97962.1 cation diffusion facilitator CzcD-associated flavoprotein CzcO [Sinobacterium caligoides]
MTRSHSTPSVGIIGAGMSGMLMAIKLLQQGKRNFTIFERAKKVGGVWRENRYPGVACDVASFSYCYEFEPNTEWSRRFSGGAEIQAYFEGIAKKYQLDDYTQFETTVTAARFTDERWQIETSSGEQHNFDVLVDATGPLNEKFYPDIPGLENFQGTTLHTADWDDDYDLNGKRVGIIGSGSSGVQATWPIAQQATQLDVFIRTPQWVMPTPNTEYGPLAKQLKRKVPLLGWLTRKFYDWVGEQFGRAALADGWRRKLVAWACEHNLKQVKDAELREKLRPQEQAMCKRMIVSDSYYKALQQDNVSVERSAITQIEADGVRTADGELHPLDLLVLATGFRPNVWGVKDITGVDGAKLEDIWQDEGSRNYQSIAVPGLSNFFMLIGPNSPITNLSLIDIADIGVDYVLQCLDKIEAGEIKTMTPKKSAAEKFGSDLAGSFDDTIWVSGCSSWYFDGSTLPQTWPWAPSYYREKLKTPTLTDFHITS